MLTGTPFATGRGVAGGRPHARASQSRADRDTVRDDSIKSRTQCGNTTSQSRADRDTVRDDDRVLLALGPEAGLNPVLTGTPFATTSCAPSATTGRACLNPVLTGTPFATYRSAANVGDLLARSQSRADRDTVRDAGAHQGVLEGPPGLNPVLTGTPFATPARCSSCPRSS